MGKKLTGVSASVATLGLGAQWENTPTDKAVAREVIRFLEDRRLLFGTRHMEDERHCVLSALEIRRFLTSVLVRDGLGDGITAALRTMRTACRRFVESGGPDGIHYSRRDPYGVDPFSMALGILRESVGSQIALLVYTYGLEVEDQLAEILPPPDDDDAGWLPGFEE